LGAAFLATAFFAGAFTAAFLTALTGLAGALGLALVFSFFVTTFLFTFLEADAFLALDAVIDESPLSQLLNLIVIYKFY
jgi:hypothetical protein